MQKNKINKNAIQSNMAVITHHRVDDRQKIFKILRNILLKKVVKCKAKVSLLNYSQIQQNSFL